MVVYFLLRNDGTVFPVLFRSFRLYFLVLTFTCRDYLFYLVKIVNTAGFAYFFNCFRDYLDLDCDLPIRGIFFNRFLFRYRMEAVFLRLPSLGISNESFLFFCSRGSIKLRWVVCEECRVKIRIFTNGISKGDYRVTCLAVENLCRWCPRRLSLLRLLFPLFLNFSVMLCFFYNCRTREV